MKKEDLIKLGIDEDIAKQVMTMHGSDITKANAVATEKETTITNLQEQLNTRDKDLKDLQKSSKDNEGLTSQLKDLQTKYDTDTQNLNDQIQKVKFDNALNEALGKTKARDPKDLRALLKMDDVKIDESGNVTGLDGQLEALQKDKAYLFDLGSSAGGYDPNKGGAKTYDSFEDAMKNNDVDGFLQQQMKREE